MTGELIVVVVVVVVVVAVDTGGGGSSDQCFFALIESCRSEFCSGVVGAVDSSASGDKRCSGETGE